MRMKHWNFKAVICDSVIFTFVVVSLTVFFWHPPEEELLNAGRNAAYTFALWGGMVAVALALSARFKTLGQVLFVKPTLVDLAEEARPFYREFWGLQLSVAFLVAFFVGLEVTEFSFAEIFHRQGLAGAQRIFLALVTPELSILPQAILAIIETIFIAFIATVFAVPTAFVLSFLCAKNIVGKTPLGIAFYLVFRSVLNFSRSIEPLIWAIIFSVWVGIGPFAGMLALLIHSVASLAKNFSELVEGISEGPIEAIEATGASRLQVIWFAVVPQIVLPYTAFTIYRWDINVRMATVIGLVGGGGIGTMLIQYQGQAMWHHVGCLVLVIAVVVLALDTASAYIREAIK
jgi:phosphonate transport system permease protein